RRAPCAGIGLRIRDALRHPASAAAAARRRRTPAARADRVRRVLVSVVHAPAGGETGECVVRGQKHFSMTGTRGLETWDNGDWGLGDSGTRRRENWALRSTNASFLSETDLLFERLMERVEEAADRPGVHLQFFTLRARQEP